MKLLIEETHRILDESGGQYHLRKNELSKVDIVFFADEASKKNGM